MTLPIKQAAEVLGEIPDWTALQERLGSPEEASPFCAALLSSSNGAVKTRPEFSAFLSQYGREILCPLELPVIEQAFEHACAGRARELIELDVSLKTRQMAEPLARASQRAGRIQLRRLKAMKAHRCVTRYADAVEAGDACGWHSVVYGIVMATFSLPLRDGLAHYARQTVRGFILAAAEPLRLTVPECREIEESAFKPALPEIEKIVMARFGSEFRVV